MPTTPDRDHWIGQTPAYRLGVAIEMLLKLLHGTPAMAEIVREDALRFVAYETRHDHRVEVVWQTSDNLRLLSEVVGLLNKFTAAMAGR